jgi:hypothetical protein
LKLKFFWHGAKIREIIEKFCKDCSVFRFRTKIFPVFKQKFVAEDRDFGVQNRVLAVQNREFSVQNREFGVQDREFGVQDREFAVQDREFVVLHPNL